MSISAGGYFPEVPVLLPDELRPRLETLAAFVTAVHATADDAQHSPEDRAAQLKQIEPPDDLPADCVSRLIQAAEKDLRTSRIRNWSELISYGRFAAAPIGAYVASLCGEGDGAGRAAESLALAVFLVLLTARCADDYRRQDRVYLPAAWMREAGCDATALGGDRTDAPLRAVLDAMLEGADRLIAEATPTFPLIRHRRLRCQAWVVTALTRRQAALLRRADPLAGPARLSRVARIRCHLAGVIRGIMRR